MKWQVLLFFSFFGLQASQEYRLFESEWYNQVEKELKDIIEQKYSKKKTRRGCRGKRGGKNEIKYREIACVGYVHQNDYCENGIYQPGKILWYPIEWGFPEKFIQITVDPQIIPESYIYSKRLKRNH